mmetsp:Transcript_17591/g.55002  ORF Transcript_17591/g.55002 Transcript_17591/m.55002 type:complete len:242 (-) Transcript_17591:26-751(-)
MPSPPSAEPSGPSPLATASAPAAPPSSSSSPSSCAASSSPRRTSPTPPGNKSPESSPRATPTRPSSPTCSPTSRTSSSSPTSAAPTSERDPSPAPPFSAASALTTPTPLSTSTSPSPFSASSPTSSPSSPSNSSHARRAEGLTSSPGPSLTRALFADPSPSFFRRPLGSLPAHVAPSRLSFFFSSYNAAFRLASPLSRHSRCSPAAGPVPPLSSNTALALFLLVAPACSTFPVTERCSVAV